MIYKDFKGQKLSALGFGAMRLPVIDGNDDKIDVEQTQKMVDLAMEKGVNYFDTAWGYHGGYSETVMGECLKKYDRSSFYIATKFPGYDKNNHGKAKEIFEKQLEKLQVDYIDFYMAHNVCELNIELYLDPQYPDIEYLIEQKKAGRIRHLGFSAHGDIPTVRRFLEKYGEHMEFCQIQLNYVDWKLQDAKGKVEMLAEYGIPVWVMEPLRGGMLTRLNEERAAILEKAAPGRTQAEWAFRFLQGIPEVCVILSGMSDYEQTVQNIATFEQDLPLTEEESAAVEAVADSIISEKSVPCTACRYCTHYCPMELDIPKLIYARNELEVTGGGFLPLFLVNSLPSGKKPSDCVSCGSCMTVCPQQINIPEVMAELALKVSKIKF